MVSWYLFHTHTLWDTSLRLIVFFVLLFFSHFFFFLFPNFSFRLSTFFFLFPLFFFFLALLFPFFSFGFSIFSFLPVFYLVYIYTTLGYTWVWPKYSSTFLGGRTLEELLLCQYDLFMFARLHLDFYIAICHFKILNV